MKITKALKMRIYPNKEQTLKIDKTIDSCRYVYNYMLARNNKIYARLALLFISSIETKFKNYRVCDGCGKHSPYANSYNEALDKAKEAGWIHYVDGNKDYCPECSKDVEDNYR